MIARLQTVGVRLVAVVLVVAAPLAGVLVTNWWRALEEGRTLAIAQLRANAAQIARDLDILRRESEWILTHMARRPSIREMRPSACTDELALLTDAHPAFYLVTLWRPDGTLVCSSIPPDPAKPAPRPHQRSFDEGIRTDGLFLSDIFVGPITGVPLATFTYPVKDGGVLVGLLSLPVRLEYLAQFLESLTMQPGGASGILDRAGTIAARQPDNARWRGKSALELSGVREEMLRGSSVTERVSIDGVRRILVHEMVPRLGWHAFVGARSEELFAGFRRQLAEGAAVFAAVVVLSLGLAYLLGRGIVRPLRQLVAVADSVAQGDHAARAAPDGAAEIALLTEHLNRMLDALEGSDKALREGNQRLRELSARLLGAQEAERMSISRGLHDQIGQELSVLKIQLDTLAPSIPDPAQRARLLAISHAASETLQRVRQISVDLRPPQLDSLGLEVALRVHVERQATLGRTAMHFESDRLPRLAEEAEIRCFRIAQEALTNVLRHAQARNAWVSLDLREGNLVLTVRDDGVGFDADAARRRGGVGLLGMQERMALAGGTLDIRTKPGQGCTVIASFPLPGPEA